MLSPYQYFSFLPCHAQSMMGGWLNHYSFRCQPVDYTDNPVAIRVSAGVTSDVTGIGIRWSGLTYAHCK